MGYRLGVDLGTTFVAAAIARGSRVDMVTLGDRTVVSPAIVYLRDDGTLVSGDAAARRAISNPDRVGREVKRRLGDPTPVMLGGVPYPVTVLLGSLLHNVIARVTETEGVKPESVVLTHPANWGPFRRELFEEVPQIAGLTEPGMVTEPEAAAAHYAASRHLSDGEIIAVYDLGGGTFDATILRKHPGGIQILGTPEGIERLGGIDFDEAILSHVNYTSGGGLSELDMSDTQTAIALARLRQDCVLAKEALSIDTETTIPVFLPNRHFDVQLTRSEFEDMIRASIESTIGTLTRTLRSAQVDPSRLAAVLLVGGSSRIPLISRMISEELGCPTVVDTHPKYAVALGAATLAAAGSSTAGSLTAEPPRPSALPRPTGEYPSGPTAGTIPAPAPLGPPPPPTRVPTWQAAAPPPTTNAPRADGRPSAQPSGHGGVWGPADAQAPRQPQADPLRKGLVGPSTAPPPGPPAPPKRGPNRGRTRALAVSAAVVVVLTLVGLIVYAGVEWVGPSRPTAGATLTASTQPAPAPEPPQVAASVPIPSIGSTIPAGQTPNFVVVSPNGRQVYIANRDAGLITVIDTAVNKVTATIPIPTGPPQFLAFSPDGHKVYISIWNDTRTIAAVDVLDATTNTIAATIPVRTRPFLAAVTPDGKRLYVPNHDSGTISVIDTATNTVTTEIKVAPNPHWIGFSPDGTRAYTANHESNLVSVIDTSNNTILAQIPVQTSPHSVAVHPTRPLVGNVNYDSMSVTMIDTNSDKVIATVPVGKNPQYITWAPDGRFAYVTNVTDNTVSVISADTFTVTATIPTGGSPTSIAVLPNGKQGYVSNLDAGTITVLNLAG